MTETLHDLYTDIVSNAPLTQKKRQLIFRSHGIATKQAPCGKLFILDQWLNTDTGLWSEEWLDVSGWDAHRILDHLGY